MHHEQKKNGYSKFEIMSMSGAVAHEVALPASIRHVEKPQALRHNGHTSKWVILALAASSSFMTTLDGSIVNIGMPSIANTFHVGISGASEWIIIGYLVVIAAVLLTFGRLADMIGRKPIFMTGLVVFLLGSALCGMAS